MPPAAVRAVGRLEAAFSGRAASLVLAACLLGNVIYAVLGAERYGQSWDDPGDAAYGQVALKAYTGSSGYLLSGDRKFYGPAYFMLSAGAVELLKSVVPSWNPVDIRHVLNFLSYQIAILAFYGLARRLVSPGPAVAASLLFAYQPVLFGHAFINQKDIPFMAAFLVAILLGLRVTDRPMASGLQDSTSERPGDGRSLGEGLTRGLREIGPIRRGVFVLLVIFGALIAADMVLGKSLLDGLQTALALSYRGQAWPPLNAVFRLVAEDAYKTPLTAYAEKVNVVYGWSRLVGASLATLPALVFGWVIARRGGANLRGYRAAVGVVLPPAIVLGIAISIRVAGIFAGGLVTLAVLLERRHRGLPALAAYWVLAASGTYLLWPFLWNAPLQRLAESAMQMASFPTHLVLFRGQAMSSGDLPWDYLPTLLSIQLTEPALLLAALGVPALFHSRHRSRPHGVLLTVVAAWFLIPLAASAFLRVPLYDGFRQVFFALPPLFLIAALGMEVIWQRVENRFLRSALVLALLSPGVAGIIALRPYEYVYYNSLIGGARGAEGLFPHDSWCTSYREAMAYINSIAPVGARVAIAEPFQVAAPFARPDLELVRSWSDPQASYLLRCNNRGDFTTRNLREFPDAYAVTRSGVPLSVVLRRETSPEEDR